MTAVVGARRGVCDNKPTAPSGEAAELIPMQSV